MSATRERALTRVLEPECMDDEQEALDYDQIDNAQVNTAFVEELLAFADDGRHFFDMGTGTALIPIELCQRLRTADVLAIDMSNSMLRIAARNVMAAGLAERITLENRDGKDTGYPAATFDVAISNSIIHHIPDPRCAFIEMLRVVRSGGTLFVRDLLRPESERQLLELVTRQAEPPAEAKGSLREMYERQRDLFHASLGAALTVAEVRAIVAPLGVPANSVQQTSDRHWTLRHRVA